MTNKTFFSFISVKQRCMKHFSRLVSWLLGNLNSAAKARPSHFTSLSLLHFSYLQYAPYVVCVVHGSFYKCEEGWEKHGGKCYYFSIRQSSWKQSRVECRAKGGDLVKIGSRYETLVIVRELMKEGEDKFWIGLTDSAVERRWLWVDGSLLDESLKFWAGKEPNNVTEGDCDGEDCVRMGEEFENKDLKSICEKAGVTAT
uniref:C-type lectin domain-containing protein n=1 Tax=Pundamilia nyererei TaxID=303518 RepID=A0A3B4FZZ9_9CICH